MGAVAIPRPLAASAVPYYTRCLKCGALAARRCATGDCRHCDTCDAAYVPCDDACPGFMVNCEADANANPIQICDECRMVAGSKLEDADARGWPEAYLAVAAMLRSGEWTIDREDDA